MDERHSNGVKERGNKREKLRERKRNGRRGKRGKNGVKR